MIKHHALALVLVALLTACGRPDSGPPPADATLNGYTVAREDGEATGDVTFNVSALDSQGIPLAGRISDATASITNVTDINSSTAVVTSQAYQATVTTTEDISLQEVVNAILNIDSSGSMSSNDRDRRRVDAAEEFINRIGDNDRLAIMDFPGSDRTTRDDIAFRYSRLLQDFTSDKSSLVEAVQNVRANGGTPLWDSAGEALALHGLDSSESAAPRVIVLFTDGLRTSGNVSFAQLLERTLETDITLYTIGLGATLDFNDLQQLADETGGTFAQVDDDTGLETLFNNVFNAVRASGTITMNITPTPPAGSTVAGSLSFAVNGVPFVLEFDNLRF